MPVDDPLRIPGAGSLGSVDVISGVALSGSAVSADRRVVVAAPSGSDISQARQLVTSGAVSKGAAGSLAGLRPGTQVEVESLGQLDFGGGAAAAGKPGSVWGVRLSATGGAGPIAVARVKLSYQGLTGGVGGDYDSRLRLVLYPSCILTTPELPECTRGVPLDTRNDTAARTLEAAVPVANDATTVSGTLTGRGNAHVPLVRQPLKGAAPAMPAATDPNDSVGVLGVAASGFGPAGNYGASDLNTTGSWAAGGSSGNFTYQYPLPEVPGVAGDTPGLAFDYDSARVDGATTSQNSQPSWVGQGWDLSTGYIERRYVPCNVDGHTTWGDLCWHSPYTTLKNQSAYVFSVDGHSSELILDQTVTGALAGKLYRAKDDEGWRFYRTTSVAANNPDRNDEAWRVEAPDGTVYWFGKAGIAQTDGSYRATNSVLTAPVYEDAGEPDGAGFHTRAYRWLLDQQYDIHENATNYFYTQETNVYKAGNGAQATYVSGAYLSAVEYGQQLGQFTNLPPAKITFDTVGRCTDVNVDLRTGAALTTTCPTMTASPSHWPDVPVDAVCSTACTMTTPTFFLKKRLLQATSWVKNTAGTGHDMVWQTIPRFAFPATLDGSSSSLWLDYVTVKTQLGTPTWTYAVDFDGTQMNNRVDWVSADSNRKKLDKRRITSIQNDTGGQILVTYNTSSFKDACRQTGVTGDTDAYFTSFWNGRDKNIKLCFPVETDPDGAGTGKSVKSIWHKYVVTQVQLDDMVGESPTEVYTYDYVDSPAWAYHDDIISDITTGMPQNWDVYRGFHQVKTTHGASTSTNRSMTYDLFFTGMDGDKNLDGTKKSIVWTDFLGNLRNDTNDLIGQVEQSLQYDEAGNELYKEVYWYVYPRQIDGPGSHDATMVRRSTTEGRTRILPFAANTWRETRSTTYWTDLGFVHTVNNSNDKAIGTDQVCTATEYAQNISAPDVAAPHYMVLPQESWTYENPTACDNTSGTAGTEVAHSRIYYDGATSLAGNATMTDGNPTSTITYTSGGTGAKFLETKQSFDVFGRLTKSATPFQQAKAVATDIAYTTGSSGYPTEIKVTGPTGASSTIFKSRWHPEPNAVKDANGNYTWYSYDALGRTTKVEKTYTVAVEADRSDQTKAQTLATYSYPAPPANAGAAPGAPLRVDSTVLVKGSGAWTGTGVTKQTSYTFVDGFGRLRQEHSISPQGDGTTVDISHHYDTRGNEVGVSTPTWFSSTPDKWIPTDTASKFKSWTHTDFDALTRPYLVSTSSLGVEQYRSTTDYFGDHSVATSPGGSTLTTWTDARGRKTKTEQDTGSGIAATTYAYASTANVGTTITVTAPPNGTAGQSTTSFSSDEAGRRTKIADSDAGTRTLAYDVPNGTVTTTTPTGSTTAVQDVLGRPVTETVKNTGGTVTQSNSWTYDTVGVPNSIGQLVSTSATTTNGGIGVTTTKSNANFDNLYQPQTQTQTVTFNPSTAVAAINNLPVTSKYTYDAAGNTTSAVQPAIGGLPEETLRPDINAYGLPNALTTTLTGASSATTIVGATSYTGSGIPMVRDYGPSAAAGVHRWFSYDMVRRLPVRLQTGYGAATASAATLWQDDNYARNTDGNVTSAIDAVTSQAQCYAYDKAFRLTQATTVASTVDASGNPTAPCSTALAAGDTSAAWNVGPGPYRSKWFFSASGAITGVTSYTASGGTATVKARTYNYTDTAHPGQLSNVTPSLGSGTNPDTLAYDGAGAATAKKTNWNSTASTADTTLAMTTGADGSLLSAIQTSGASTIDSKFGYDEGGQRTARVTSTTVTIYSGSTEVSLARNSGVLTGTRRYSLGGAVVATRTGNGAIAFLFDDAQGSNTISVPSTGAYTASSGSRQRYTPYGALRGQSLFTLPTQHGWLGQTSDEETGLAYLNARYYDPQLTRFLAPDPLIAPDEPATLNAYTYANGNPATFTDASGLAVPGAQKGGDGSCGAPGLPACASSSPKPKPPASKAPVVSESEHSGTRISQGKTRSEMEPCHGSYCRSHYAPRPNPTILWQDCHGTSCATYKPPRTPFSVVDAAGTGADVGEVVFGDSRAGKAFGTVGSMLDAYQITEACLVARSGEECASAGIDALMGAHPIGVVLKIELVLLRADAEARMARKEYLDTLYGSWDSHEYIPQVQKQLLDRGARFQQGLAAASVGSNDINRSREFFLIRNGQRGLQESNAW